jgi:glycosyltransferase involved in cell wall biosynthesis
MARLFVGLPVYNGESHIEATITSLLEQTYEDFLLTVSDNCSTDATEEICRRLVEQDNRVRYTRMSTNRGATENYNILARSSEGEYFKWASSNDTCDRTFFEKCIQALEQDPFAVLSYPKTKLLDLQTGDLASYDDDLHLVAESPAERFIAVLERLSLNNVMNGVFRLKELKASCLIGNFIAGDKNMIAELALNGHIVEVPEYLFIRKMDRETATKLQTEDEVQKHMDPRHDKPMLFQYSKQMYWYFRSVLTADIPLREKVQVLKYLTRRVVRTRDHLADDLGEAARRLVRK